MTSFETAHLPREPPYPQYSVLSNRCSHRLILRRCGISTLTSILRICSTMFFIVTWLGWSCACVSFEIERTRWCCRNSSICALCTISAIAIMCTVGFRFETVALRRTYAVALIEFSWIEPAECTYMPVRAHIRVQSRVFVTFVLFRE